MDHSKLTKRAGRGKRLALLAAAAALALCMSVGSVVAYLATSSGAPLRNVFGPARVACEVTERFDGTEKSEVSVKNTGSVRAYIRAAILVNWVSAEDAEVFSAAAPTAKDYSVTYNTTDWVYREEDGYYYYRDPVEPGEATAVLIQKCVPLTQRSGYRLSVDVVASAIQAEGTTADGVPAARDAWGIDPAALDAEGET